MTPHTGQAEVFFTERVFVDFYLNYLVIIAHIEKLLECNDYESQAQG